MVEIEKQAIGNREVPEATTIGPYIVDFVSFECKLVVELDGGQHNEQDVFGQDLRRTDYLKGRGYQVFRFWNNEVMTNIDGVIEKINGALASGSPSP